ncbi:hypothetical protein BDN71DRAFT_1456657 [Pleurotus eryngii]|uniref:Uncharacterized protein n=1 Tax=Pleurotus eryngii TaxID=5323 RepID=A0A9P6D1P3_PLEER|nr:hypothetical protein BDN71DRAFT_1456657 [Pleurotus eryngii]
MNEGASQSTSSSEYLSYLKVLLVHHSRTMRFPAFVVIAALALSVAGAPVENGLIKGPPPPDNMSVCGKIAYTANAIKETIKDKLRGCLKIGGSAMG